MAGVLAGGALAAWAAPWASALEPVRPALFPRLAGLGAPGGVALTFDDGPDPRGTPAVLEHLDRLGWRATFFLLGSMARRNPGLAAEVAAAGHEVAVHGFAHRTHLLRHPGRLVDDVRRGRDAGAEATGRAPAMFRPPYGTVSAGTLVAARAAGLRLVLWSSWGRDWRAGITPDDVAADLRRGLRPGATILLHDSDCTSAPGSWRTTAAALPRLADDLAARGLAVRTLAEHLA